MTNLKRRSSDVDASNLSSSAGKQKLKKSESSDPLILPTWFQDIKTWQKQVAALIIIGGPFFLVFLFSSYLDFSYTFSACFFIVTEILLMTVACVLAFTTWTIRFRRRPARLPGKTVDVFITTYDEDLTILRNTIRACIALEYPHKTYVLDDGRRVEVKALADELGVHYITRKDNRHAKAGNLNHALSITDGEFIAIFDADNIPMRNFLVESIGHFADPKVAVVQPNQMYYNLDAFNMSPAIRRSGLWSEQSLYFDTMLAGRDAHGALTWCGGGALLRRQALIDCGGVATETVTEDFHTTFHLFKAGYKIVYHAEYLLYVLASQSCRAFLIQRERWQIGTLQTWLLEWKGIFSKGILDIHRRVTIFWAPLQYYGESIPRIAVFFFPFLLLLSKGHLLTGGWEIVPLLLALPLSRTYLFNLFGRGRGEEYYNGVFYFLKMHRYLKNLILFFMYRKPVRFRVTPKGPSEEGSSKDLWVPLIYLLWSLGVFTASCVLIEDNGPNPGLVIAWIYSAQHLILCAHTCKIVLRKPLVKGAFSFLTAAPVRFSIEDGKEGEMAGMTTLISEREIWLIHPRKLKRDAQINLTITLGDGTMDVSGKVATRLRSVISTLGVLRESIVKLDPLSQEQIDSLWDYQIEEGLMATFHRYTEGKCASREYVERVAPKYAQRIERESLAFGNS